MRSASVFLWFKLKLAVSFQAFDIHHSCREALFTTSGWVIPEVHTFYLRTVWGHSLTWPKQLSSCLLSPSAGFGESQWTLLVTFTGVSTVTFWMVLFLKAWLTDPLDAVCVLSLVPMDKLHFYITVHNFSRGASNLYLICCVCVLLCSTVHHHQQGFTCSLGMTQVARVGSCCVLSLWSWSQGVRKERKCLHP